METVLKSLGVKSDDFEKFRFGTEILMVIFFLVFGAASLVVLINSPA